MYIFLGPLLGAGFISSTGYDQKNSDWATGDSFIFKDDEAATKYSDTLLEILQTEAYASIFLLLPGQMTETVISLRYFLCFQDSSLEIELVYWIK